MDTAVIPEELKPYLSLYLEVLFESPVLRDGGTRNLLWALNFSTKTAYQHIASVQYLLGFASKL